MKHLDEVWVAIDLLPNYEVSNYGRIVNVKKGKDLKPSADSNGYFRVALYHNGVRHDVYIHRLVAKCFFLNYKDGVEVLHKNLNKSDNSVLNLTLGGVCRKPSRETLW